MSSFVGDSVFSTTIGPPITTWMGLRYGSKPNLRIKELYKIHLEFLSFYINNLLSYFK